MRPGAQIVRNLRKYRDALKALHSSWSERQKHLGVAATAFMLMPSNLCDPYRLSGASWCGPELATPNIQVKLHRPELEKPLQRPRCRCQTTIVRGEECQTNSGIFLPFRMKSWKS